jgi:hypothetical protein
MTDDEVTTLRHVPDREGYGLLRTAGCDAAGTVGIMTDPNDVRYVCSQVVRRMMDPEDDDTVASIVEPAGVASWDHRKLT